MKIHEFDFTTPGDWDTPGDGAIVNDRLTLDDPVTVLYWNTHWWSTVPSQDGNGDRALASSVTYRIDNDGTSFELGDYIFVFNLKFITGSGSSSLKAFHHYTHDITPARIESRFNRPGVGNDLRWYVYHSNGWLRRGVNLFLSTTHGWPEGSFREVRQAFRSNQLSCGVGDSTLDDVFADLTPRLDMDDTDNGDIALELLWGGNKWILGDGETGTQPSPFLCQRKQGGGQLKAASAWDLTNVTALGRMMTVGDLAGGGDLPLPVDLRYNHYNGSSWTGWTALADDGDISSLSCGSGKKLLVGVTDGSTGGMDTMCDTAFRNGQGEYAPTIDAILVEHTVPESTHVGLRSGGYTGGPNRGERD